MPQKKEISLKDLAVVIKARVTVQEDKIVDDILEPETADEKSIIYLSHKKYIDRINKSPAKVVLTSKDIPVDTVNNKILLISKDLQDSFNRLLNFFEYKNQFSHTISEKASISSDVKLAENIHIDDFVVIKEKSIIEDNTVLHSCVYIGNNVTIGKNCVIYPYVTLYDGTIIGNNVIIHGNTVIGSDGFGYLQKNNKNIKIPQIGNVIIEDNVEIGSNTSIDRATIGSTIIRKGVKIDNIVQIAHNVIIGENTIVASQTGISGSTTIGKNCILAGQAGIADHAIIEDNVIIGAKTGITSRVVKSEEKMLFGIPGKTILKAKRIESIISKLPEMYQEFNELKKIVNKGQ